MHKIFLTDATRTFTLFNLFLFILASCNSQKLNYKASDKFIWSKGPEPNNNYRYNIALSSSDKIYVTGGDNSGSFETYNTKMGRWETLPGLPTPRMFVGGTILNNNVYIIGGIDTFLKNSTKVEKYNLQENKWTTCKELSMPRSRLAVVTCNKKIYIIGGLEGKSDKDSKNSSALEEYDPETDTWKIKTNMPTPRHGHCAILVNNKILVVGGYTDNGPTGIVEEYDPQKDTWTKKAEMLTPRGFFGLVMIENNIYAIAGRVHQDKGPIEFYNYKTDSWLKLEPMPEWRNRFGITTINNNIYIIGGEDSPKSFLICEIKKE